MKTSSTFLFSLLFIGYSSVTTVSGQEWCGTDMYNQQKINADPALYQKIQEQEELISQNVALIENSSQSRAGTKIIPVVVHVIHYNGDGNISKEQIEDGIRILNLDFKRLNSDTSSTRNVFKPYAADAEMEFRLAKIDPNGNCTEGIVRVNSPLTYEATDDVKAISYWSSSKYFNVWIVKSIEGSGAGITLGYAQFPGWGNWDTYGFVNRGDQWGSIGTSVADGRTATHEIGHCFNLYHTFQGGCGSSCSSSGDRVCDTPPVLEATWTCSSTLNTCSNDAGSGSPYASDVADQIENYMSYDNCQNMFTTGQKNRMDAAITSIPQLQNLISPANLIATGTEDGHVASLCAPIADFLANKNFICENTPVTFTDLSYNGDVTSWNWSFPGGNPVTSTVASPSIQYPAAGNYQVSLTAINSAGNNTTTKTGYITILSSAPKALPLNEGFETIIFPNTQWAISNPDGAVTWAVATPAATGTKSLKLRNYVNVINQKDELISSAIDLSGQTAAYVNFKSAYRQRAATDSDKLYVYTSTDCGNTWALKLAKSGSSLSSDGIISSVEFTPNASQWKTWKFAIPASELVAGVMLKFMAQNGGGNNIYIDDIMITDANGTVIGSGTTIFENNNNTNFNIYPNPTSGAFKLELNSNGLETQLEIMNFCGQVVYKKQLSGKSNYSENIDLSSQSSGIYFVKVTSEIGVATKKVVLK